VRRSEPIREKITFCKLSAGKQLSLLKHSAKNTTTVSDGEIVWPQAHVCALAPDKNAAVITLNFVNLHWGQALARLLVEQARQPAARTDVSGLSSAASRRTPGNRGGWRRSVGSEYEQPQRADT
jgi:hypothetical protein